MQLQTSEIFALLAAAMLSLLLIRHFFLKEKAILRRIKKDFEMLTKYQNLTTDTSLTNLLNDRQVLSHYYWAADLLLERGAPCKRFDASVLAAETIICERLLRLSAIHAVRVLSRIDNVKSIARVLDEVVREIEDDDDLPNYRSKQSVAD